jgi:hypothetical protein
MKRIEDLEITSRSGTQEVWSDDPTRVIGFLIGLMVAAISLSSGFIWVCGDSCIQEGIIWTPQRRGALAFLAAWFTWWGYLIAHWAVTGRLIHTGTPSSEEQTKYGLTTPAQLLRSKLPSKKTDIGAFILGIAMLVAGIFLGFIFIREGNHLLTYTGGVLFFSGYVIAHYVDTGVPL